MSHQFYGKKKIIIIALIAVVLVAAVAVIIVTSILFNDNDNVEPKLSITSWPTKLSYYVGEKADYSGLVLIVPKDNKGKTENVAYTEETKDQFQFSGFDTSKPVEEQAITVEYGGLTCQFYITVKPAIKPTPVLVRIEISVMPKQNYVVGEKLLDVNDGMIMKYYSDGTMKQTMMIPDYVENWKEVREKGAGTYTLSVKYKENGVLLRTSYEVTFTEPETQPEE